jgi:hypothetical protein
MFIKESKTTRGEERVLEERATMHGKMFSNEGKYLTGIGFKG